VAIYFIINNNLLLMSVLLSFLKVVLKLLMVYEFTIQLINVTSFKFLTLALELFYFQGSWHVSVSMDLIVNVLLLLLLIDLVVHLAIGIIITANTSTLLDS
jgi:hypothetical protein